MKIEYEAPFIEIMLLSSADIITASGNETGGWDGEGDPIETPSVGI